MEIYLDSAKFSDIEEGIKLPEVKGFTTNPTLMKAAGVTNYSKFSKELIARLKDERPDTTLSLEVFADDLGEMEKQAFKIAEWGDGYPLFVKIPITNTVGESTAYLVEKLNANKVRVNVTAVFTEDQTDEILERLSYVEEPTDLIISVFAGRIADTGRNPLIALSEQQDKIYFSKERDFIKLLWASTREVFNYYDALNADVDIITMPLDLIKKLKQYKNKDLTEFSRETVQMFYNAAKESGFTID